MIISKIVFYYYRFVWTNNSEKEDVEDYFRQDSILSFQSAECDARTDVSQFAIQLKENVLGPARNQQFGFWTCLMLVENLKTVQN